MSDPAIATNGPYSNLDSGDVSADYPQNGHLSASETQQPNNIGDEHSQLYNKIGSNEGSEQTGYEPSQVQAQQSLSAMDPKIAQNYGADYAQNGVYNAPTQAAPAVEQAQLTSDPGAQGSTYAAQAEQLGMNPENVLVQKKEKGPPLPLESEVAFSVTQDNYHWFKHTLTQQFYALDECGFWYTQRPNGEFVDCDNEDVSRLLQAPKGPPNDTITEEMLNIVPLDINGKPVYPTNDKGKFVLPTNVKGEKKFPIDKAGFPLFPWDYEKGQWSYPVDDSGDPVFPCNKDGKPVVPLNKEGKAIYPKRDDGQVIFPQQSDLPIPGVTNMGRAILPVDDNGVVILPYDEHGMPLIGVAADGFTPLDPQQFAQMKQAYMYQQQIYGQGYFMHRMPGLPPQAFGYRPEIRSQFGTQPGAQQQYRPGFMPKYGQPQGRPAMDTSQVFERGGQAAPGKGAKDLLEARIAAIGTIGKAAQDLVKNAPIGATRGGISSKPVNTYPNLPPHLRPNHGNLSGMGGSGLGYTANANNPNFVPLKGRGADMDPREKEILDLREKLGAKPPKLRPNYIPSPVRRSSRSPNRRPSRFERMPGEIDERRGNRRSRSRDRDRRRSRSRDRRRSRSRDKDNRRSDRDYRDRSPRRDSRRDSRRDDRRYRDDRDREDNYNRRDDDDRPDKRSGSQTDRQEDMRSESHQREDGDYDDKDDRRHKKKKKHHEDEKPAKEVSDAESQNSDKKQKKKKKHKKKKDGDEDGSFSEGEIRGGSTSRDPEDKSKAKKPKDNDEDDVDPEKLRMAAIESLVKRRPTTDQQTPETDGRKSEKESKSKHRESKEEKRQEESEKSNVVAKREPDKNDANEDDKDRKKKKEKRKKHSRSRSPETDRHEIKSKKDDSQAKADDVSDDEKHKRKKKKHKKREHSHSPEGETPTKSARRD